MANPNSSKPAYLDPSPLGTKEYWDTLYTTDLSTRTALPSHTGQTWFDDSGAEEKTLRFLEDHADELGLDPACSSFLDLGTGNASMLVSLRADGWTGGEWGLWGCDYSRESVELGRRVVTADDEDEDQDKDGENDDDEGEDDGEDRGSNDAAIPKKKPSIRLLQHDIFSPPPSDFPVSGFDVVLDKGTFDAISLSDAPLPSGRRMCEEYAEAVLPLVRKGGGLLLITSCNWTEEELRKWIEGERMSNAPGDGELSVVGRVKYSSFKFGGNEGSTLAGVCWKRI